MSVIDSGFALAEAMIFIVKIIIKRIHFGREVF